jgi:hypothetical protein
MTLRALALEENLRRSPQKAHDALLPASIGRTTALLSSASLGATVPQAALAGCPKGATGAEGGARFTMTFIGAGQSSLEREHRQQPPET